ncbi:MAG TPA: hypothetical protein VE964_03250 [Myxococcales bacterium]|nr:hypothetical protein [Myxococcales bacterium]
MLRAAVAAAVLATAYCGAKGPPQPPVHEAPDGGSPSTAPSTSPSTSTSTPPSPSTSTSPSTPDAGSP